MAIYTVLAPQAPAGAPPAATDPLALVFVREGFSWPALLIAELWLLYRRMWLVFVLYIAVIAAAWYVDRQIGGPFVSVFLALAHLLFALEGNQLRRWSLARRGYSLVGVVEGKGLAEAEIRYFHGQEAAAPAGITPDPALPPAPPAIVPVPPPAPPAPPVRPPMQPLGAVAPSAEAGDVVGLFPSPPGTVRP